MAAAGGWPRSRGGGARARSAKVTKMLSAGGGRPEGGEGAKMERERERKWIKVCLFFPRGILVVGG